MKFSKVILDMQRDVLQRKRFLTRRFSTRVSLRVKKKRSLEAEVGRTMPRKSSFSSQRYSRVFC